jgi:hypothetical protein
LRDASSHLGELYQCAVVFGLHASKLLLERLCACGCLASRCTRMIELLIELRYAIARLFELCLQLAHHSLRIRAELLEMTTEVANALHLDIRATSLECKRFLACHDHRVGLLE